MACNCCGTVVRTALATSTGTPGGTGAAGTGGPPEQAVRATTSTSAAAIASPHSRPDAIVLRRVRIAKILTAAVRRGNCNQRAQGTPSAPSIKPQRATANCPAVLISATACL